MLLGNAQRFDGVITRTVGIRAGRAVIPFVQGSLRRLQQALRLGHFPGCSMLRAHLAGRCYRLSGIAHFLHRCAGTSDHRQHQHQKRKLSNCWNTEAHLPGSTRENQRDAKLSTACLPVKRGTWGIFGAALVRGREVRCMAKVTIWHNPRCTKSRETLALLQSRDSEIRIIEYLKNPPSPAEIRNALTLLRIEPRALMRTNEAEYRAHQLDNPALSRQQLIEAMHAHPILIQRPVVFANGQARIGRPPESVLEIL